MSKLSLVLPSIVVLFLVALTCAIAAAVVECQSLRWLAMATAGVSAANALGLLVLVWVGV